ncbi:MAG: OmpA family protein [Syntrophales bacterium]|nr:OmpA family protein [Syntrophales bacterium]
MNKITLLGGMIICILTLGCAPNYSLMDSDSHSKKGISPREDAQLSCLKSGPTEECMRSKQYSLKDQTPSGVKVDELGCPLDSDGDGVPDHLDKCPGTPEGVKVDSRGCPLDSDGDGVPDYLDKCLETPEGVEVDCKGCPLDSDSDGVSDSFDKCPGTPLGALIDEDGCWTIGEPLFDFDKSDIKTEYHPILDQVIIVFERNPSLRAEVRGYTDNFGAQAYNQILSNRRAEAVVSYLVQGGVDRNRLYPVGYGFSTPRASNESAEGRALNRRVEILPVQ